MDIATYQACRAQARRLTRTADEADDLVQDALVAALEAGRHDMPWLSGVLRQQAAMRVRGDVRRRRRESASADPVEVDPEPAAASSTEVRALMDALSPASRRVAVLALHGLNAEEVRCIVGLNAAAFRQRLTAIRKTLARLSPDVRAGSLALAYVRDPTRSGDLPFGLVRRALKAALQGDHGLGTHDADGHLLILRTGAHTSGPGGNQ